MLYLEVADHGFQDDQLFMTPLVLLVQVEADFCLSFGKHSARIT